MKKMIQTEQAPAAIGCYSQAIQTGKLVFLAGQIPLDPSTMTIVEGGIKAQVIRVFDNMKTVCAAAGGTFDNMVKLTVFLIDINHAAIVNEVMKDYFKEPYPARTSIAVAALPKNALVEVEAIMVRE